MASLATKSFISPQRPVLDLSGPRLRATLERLIAASEPIGGVERFAEAVKLKSVVFQERIGEGRAASLTRSQIAEIVPLMPTVRRRIAPLIDARAWGTTHAAIVALLDNAHDTTIADQRIAAFESALSSPTPRFSRGEGRGEGRQQAPEQAVAPHPSPLPAEGAGRGNSRFLRDLAAEILHNVLPEHYPLMQRWVWDTKANSGVLREVWHDAQGGSDSTDHIVIDVADRYETFLVLREELSQFLADNGVFRDMLWHVDLLCAQIYGDYINAQGGAWLKTEFGSESDPLEHTRRIIGLDRVAGKPVGKDKTIDGAVETVPPTKLLS